MGKHHSKPETLFLTVNIIDRYLSVKPVARKKLQLLGVVAMLIAAKFEEIDPPRVHELSYLTDKTCSKKDILNMEEFVAPLPAMGALSVSSSVQCKSRIVTMLRS